MLEGRRKLIHATAQGVPRMVNQLAGNALMIALKSNDNVEERHVGTILTDMERQRGSHTG